MYVHMFVSPRAAIKAGKANSGYRLLNLSEKDLVVLTDEEREELARTYKVGAVPWTQSDEQDLRRSDQLVGRHAHDPEIPEATTETLRQVLQARIAHTKRQQAEKQAELDELREKLQAVYGARTTTTASNHYVDVYRDETGQRQEGFKSGTYTRQYYTTICPDWPFISSSRPDMIQVLADFQAQPDVSAWLAELGAENETRRRAALEVAIEKWDAHAAARIEKERRELETQEKEAAFLAVVYEAVDLWGDENQRARRAANLLSEREAIAVVRDHLFASLSEQSRYARLSSADIEHAESCYHGGEIQYEVEEAEYLTADEWDVYAGLERLAPEEAQITPRFHRATCDECEQCVTRTSALITVEWHGRKLSREYSLEY